MRSTARKLLRRATHHRHAPMIWALFALSAGLLTLLLFAAGQPWTALAAALAVAALALALLSSQNRSRDRLLGTLRQIDQQQRQDRKDASRWEWRIAHHLSVLTGRSIDDGGAPGAKGQPEKDTGSVVPPADLALLRDAGFFDLDHYSAAAGIDPEDLRGAQEHFLTSGMAAGLSCTPLLEVSRLPPDVANRWKRGDLRAVIRYLQRPRSGIVPTSDVFTPSLLPLQDDATQRHPGGCLGWWYETASDREFLPSEDVTVRWEDHRRATAIAARQTRDTARLMAPRRSDTWDQDAEVAWKTALPERDPEAEGPLVSVIMPAWNRRDLLADAISSVSGQRYPSWELLVVDDGSDDGSVDHATAIAAGDDRIRIIAAEHQGVSAARNRGIEEAQGELLAFLDTDNHWETDFLDLMVRGMLHSGAETAYAGMSLSSPDGISYRGFRGGRDELSVLNHIDLNVLMVRREAARAVAGFDTGLRRWVDHDFALRLSARSEPEFFPFIGCRYDDRSSDSGPRITSDETDHWQWPALSSAWVDWSTLRDGIPDRVPGRVSVVMPTYGHHDLTRVAVQAVLSTTIGHDVEVVIVDNGSPQATSLHLNAVFAQEPGVSVIRVPRNLNFALGSNIGIARSTGQYVLFLNNDTEVREGWLPPLLETLGLDGVIAVQPVLHYPDDSIQTAGTVFSVDGGLPSHLLAQMPPEDADAVAGLDFPALTGAAMLMRATDAIEAHGFDPLFVNGMEDVDLCLRLARRDGARLRVEPRSHVRHWESRTPGRSQRMAENRRIFLDRWSSTLPPRSDHIFRQVGLEVVHVGGDGMSPPAPIPVFARTPGGPRRWGIRYAAVGGSKGDRWGDTAFVSSLAAALRETGDEVVTYRHGANTQYLRCVDDVHLVIRGLDRVAPVPGRINILWIISHPDKVTREELAGFDLVYAASESWARRMTRKWGIEVTTLLQATDTRFFQPTPDPSDGARGPTFVGSVHTGRRRGVVEDALSARIPFTVIGSGWGSRLPSDVLEADNVPNHRLPAVYRSADRVLADHWPMMAAEGFIQNRLFDAVACGALVVSDPVEGIDEVFGSTVRTYESVEELRHLCSPEADREFASPEVRSQTAARIAREHSFGARAGRFQQDVDHLLEGRTRRSP